MANTGPWLSAAVARARHVLLRAAHAVRRGALSVSLPLTTEANAPPAKRASEPSAGAWSAYTSEVGPSAKPSSSWSQQTAFQAAPSHRATRAAGVASTAVNEPAAARVPFSHASAKTVLENWPRRRLQVPEVASQQATVTHSTPVGVATRRLPAAHTVDADVAASARTTPALTPGTLAHATPSQRASAVTATPVADRRLPPTTSVLLLLLLLLRLARAYTLVPTMPPASGLQWSPSQHAMCRTYTELASTQSKSPPT